MAKMLCLFAMAEKHNQKNCHQLDLFVCIGGQKKHHIADIYFMEKMLGNVL